VIFGAKIPVVKLSDNQLVIFGAKIPMVIKAE
jgi:hypothetical protein